MQLMCSVSFQHWTMPDHQLFLSHSFAHLLMICHLYLFMDDLPLIIFHFHESHSQRSHIFALHCFPVSSAHIVIVDPLFQSATVLTELIGFLKVA